MLKITKKHSNLVFIILSIVIGLPALLGLLHAGFPQTDDGNWMVIRFSAFFQTLRAGQFPVRFLMRLNNGYGYPVADFLYPLFMYVGVPLHVFGLNFVNTIKTVLMLSLISSSLFSFLWLRKLFDNLSALVGSIFYTYFPYHLLDVYKRGSVGEVLSLALVPFVLWQIERRSFIFVSLGVALLILAHNTLALFFVSLVFVYSLLKGKQNLKFSILSLALGIGISAFFWQSAFYDLKFTIFNNIKISDFSTYLLNSNNLLVLGFSFAFFVLESILFSFAKKNKKFIYLFIFTLFLSFLTLSISSSFWNLIPFKNLIQFPFRIISIILVLSSFMTAYMLNSFKNSKKNVVAIIYIVLIFFSALPFITNLNYQNYPDTFYSTNQDSTTVKNEYMPKWVKQIPVTNINKKVQNLTNLDQVATIKNNANTTQFNLNLENPSTIQVNTIYFPGWVAFVNGKESKISYENPLGLIRLNLDKGQNAVVIVFKETSARLFADLISVFSLILLFSAYFILKKKRYNL